MRGRCVEPEPRVWYLEGHRGELCGLFLLCRKTLGMKKGTSDTSMSSETELRKQYANLQQRALHRGTHGHAGLCGELTTWRNSTEMPWLADAPVHPQQQALKDPAWAYANFFARRTDFPRFKKQGQGDSFRYPDPKQVKLDQASSLLFLPRLGWLRYHNSRDVMGTVKPSP